MTNYIDAPGSICPMTNLRAPKAILLAESLDKEKIEYSKLVECRTMECADIVVFDLGIEISQIQVHSINSIERVAACFSHNDEAYPKVLAMRADFPVVPHLYLRYEEIPRSLCLYEESYHDVKRRWTPARFVNWIRDRLALTAKGRLHQEDQPLEQLLSGTEERIIVPDFLSEKNCGKLPKLLYLTVVNKDPFFFIAHTRKPINVKVLPIITSLHTAPPQQHGIIQRSPSSLTEFGEYFQRLGYDLLDDLRNRLKAWQAGLSNEDRKARLLLLVICPKTREVGTDVESLDIFAIMTSEPLDVVGEKLGIWKISEGHLCQLIGNMNIPNDEIPVHLLNPAIELTRRTASICNGEASPSELSIVGIGAGALGSQVIMNLIRSGFGKWIFIDNDRLMPHNLARHALSAPFLGLEKSTAIRDQARIIISDEEYFSAIPADVLNPGKYADQITDVFAKADIILDMSANLAVERFVSLDIDSDARCISLFLNRSGDDLVALAEDKERSIKLDQLEMQYYRALLSEDMLSQHFRPPNSRIRYGQSCRDISSTLSQDKVALHSAIASRHIKEVANADNPSITVWRSDNSSNVSRVNIGTYPGIRKKIGEWTLCSDEGFLSKIRQLRNNKLPNETGGVLLGSFDLDRKIVYVVDTIPSPPDSTEWPMLYIRGCKGLKETVRKIFSDSDGALEYIGEWHSHSTGLSTRPSQDDDTVFSWLTEWMDKDGLLALMMIAGDADISCHLGQITIFEKLLSPTCKIKE